MSIITTPPKSRVTHRRGYRLGIEDGVTPSRDEIGVTRVPWDITVTYIDSNGVARPLPNRQSIATERKSDSVERIMHRENERNARYGWIVTHDDRDGHLTRLVSDAKIESKPVRQSRPAPTPKIKSVPSARPSSNRSDRARSRESIDAMIRATGYTGPIDRRMREAARDVVAHQTQVRSYTRKAA